MSDATNRQMTEEDWNRFDAVVRYVAQHAEFWQHGPVLTRGLAELPRLRAPQGSDVATMRSLAERLLERLCLLDFAIVEHHSSSIMRPGIHTCPACAARGSTFFYDTYNLIERAQNLLASLPHPSTTTGDPA